MCYSQQPISRPACFFEVDCISIISGEESFNVHSSCSAGSELGSGSGAGLKANRAEAERRFLPLKGLSAFYLISGGDCGALHCCGGMKRFGLVSGFGAAASRSEGSQRQEFSFWQRPAGFCVFKREGFSKQRKNAHQNSRRRNMTQEVFPPRGVICFWFTPTRTSQNYE